MPDPVVRFGLVGEEDDSSRGPLLAVVGNCLREVGRVASLFEQLEAALVEIDYMWISFSVAEEIVRVRILYSVEQAVIGR